MSLQTPTKSTDSIVSPYRQLIVFLRAMLRVLMRLRVCVRCVRVLCSEIDAASNALAGIRKLLYTVITETLRVDVRQARFPSDGGQKTLRHKSGNLFSDADV